MKAFGILFVMGAAALIIVAGGIVFTARETGLTPDQQGDVFWMFIAGFFCLIVGGLFLTTYLVRSKISVNSPRWREELANKTLQVQLFKEVCFLLDDSPSQKYSPEELRVLMDMKGRLAASIANRNSQTVERFEAHSKMLSEANEWAQNQLERDDSPAA